jgi:hypothetical protein
MPIIAPPLSGHRSSVEDNLTSSTGSAGESKMFKELFSTANKSKGIAGIIIE